MSVRWRTVNRGGPPPPLPGMLSRLCRGFCPSCGARRMAPTAAHLVEHVIAACAGAAVGAVTSDPAFARHSQSTGLTESGLSYCWLHNPSW